MGLMLKRQRDGVLRESWYGVFTDSDGKRRVINLNVKVTGTPPKSMSLSEPGDVAFERSRTRAKDALAQFVEEAKHKGNAQHLTERLIEMKTGSTVEYSKISELLDKWLSIPRDEDLSPGYKTMCKAILGRFERFMKDRNPKAFYLYQVTEGDVTAFANEVRASMSPKTYREHLRLLRPAFDRFLPAGHKNPFRTAIMKRKGGKAGEAKSVHRSYFDEDQLQKIFDAAKGDSLMYPLLVAAACTGMRRGDLCKLKWSAVDLQKNTINVAAAKTGERLDIPVFPLLRSVLEPRIKNGSKYVFPEAAKMLEENPGGLTYRCKAIIARALDGKPLAPAEEVPDIFEDEAIEAVRANIPEGDRRDRMVEVVHRYAAGEGIRTIEKEMGVSKAGISNDIHAIEGWLKKPLMRKRGGNIKAMIQRNTRAPRSKGMKSASIRDFHAMRTSFVTLALRNGTPIELVKRVTGHQTTSIVLEHYFRPNAADFRDTLGKTLPDVLTGNKSKNQTAGDELAVLVGKIQSQTATAADKKRFKLLAAKV